MESIFLGIFISLVIGFPIVALFILLIMDQFSNSDFFCKKFGWHKKSTKTTKDRCSRCGEEILQDNNVDWFS